MFTKEQIFEKLTEENYSIDIDTMSDCLRLWRIDPFYEDENKVEYFDELTISRLKQGLDLKNQSVSDEDILLAVNNCVINNVEAVSSKAAPIHSEANFAEGELQKVTVDITTQTLSLLAESIAQKISADIANKVQDADIFKPAVDIGKLIRDNEILSRQVKRLLDENKNLISRINDLEQEKSQFKNVFGNFYMKL